ncbi:UNVERIFIED_CONTAM: hypothetical protein PYX00_011336 [Menopon gallinae]|uniref:Eukaryotic translation initiation factor 2 subunit 1 n=1 Tax=Menopon gallinae TaxID=328185 RepID=A0AAW2H7M3_9NEOP
MDYSNCRYHEQEFPCEGEIVIGRISKVADLGVFIEMIEYNNLEGLIVVGELTRKRINSAQKTVKTGKIEVAMVSRVDRKKRYVDLSRIKVSNNERVQCLQAHHRNKAAHNTMITIAQKLGTDLLGLYKEFGWPKAREYGSLYNYFLEVQNKPELVSGLDIEEEVLESIRLRFKVDKIKVCAEIRVVCTRSRGIHAIKEALTESLTVDKDIDVSLVKPPLYSISKVGYIRQHEVGIVNAACARVRDKITGLGGSFALVSGPTVLGEKRQAAGSDTRGLNDVRLQPCDSKLTAGAPMDRDNMQGKMLGYEQFMEEIAGRKSRVYHVYGLLVSKGVLKYEDAVLSDPALLVKTISKHASSETAHVYRDRGLDW